VGKHSKQRAGLEVTSKIRGSEDGLSEELGLPVCDAVLLNRESKH